MEIYFFCIFFSPKHEKNQIKVLLKINKKHVYYFRDFFRLTNNLRIFMQMKTGLLCSLDKVFPDLYVLQKPESKLGREKNLDLFLQNRVNLSL